MNSYIPKQPKQSRERLEAKIDSRLARKLESYCEYIESGRDYVVAQALELVFRKDKGFVEWLGSRERVANTEAVSDLNGNARDATRKL